MKNSYILLFFVKVIDSIDIIVFFYFYVNTKINFLLFLE